MSGEKSKSSGEYGEKIANELLKLIGWENALSGKDIPCVRKDHIGANGGNRNNHGVDYIIKYSCPLVSKTESDILVSVKHRKNYPSTSKGKISDFKEFLKDIAEATECYPSHELFKEKIIGTKNMNICNVIMWFSALQDEQCSGVIEDIADFRNSDAVNYGTVYLLDNKKATFLYSSIQHARNKDDKFLYFYPDTGLNMDTVFRTHQGNILPVQYINSPIQLFKIIAPTGESLIITVEDEFNIDYFERLLQFARLLTVGWATKIFMAFPNYNDYSNSASVKKSLSRLTDRTFAQKIIVESLNYSDFRNLGGI
ncbi:MAG: GapS4a family protein [Thermincolia bacterium]